jgi:hypothetical protein
MALLPPIARLVLETFPNAEQKWLPLLLQPLNSFIESVYGALNRSLTLRENMAADIKELNADSLGPFKLAWNLKQRPVAVFIGNIRRTDGSIVALPAAVSIRWSFTQAGELQIDQIIGITPTASEKYTLTLVCFTG